MPKILTLIFVLVLFSSCEQREKPRETNVAPAVDAVGDTAYSKRDSLVVFAKKYLGVPYVAAGKSPEGFDCSGFVYYVFHHFNVDVPRSTIDFENFGTDIPIDQVRKGDLILFLSPTRPVIGHMGIVVRPDGMNSDFIHSTSGKQMSVVVTSLSTPGYTKRFVKAIRVLSNDDPRQSRTVRSGSEVNDK